MFKQFVRLQMGYIKYHQNNQFNREHDDEL